ncbi:hypothetical protein N309_15248, partial [Tinamus guttatus]
QLEAGPHTHLCSPALPKPKSDCTCIYQIAGTKKKSSFLLPVFLAFNLPCLLLVEAGGDHGLFLSWAPWRLARRFPPYPAGKLKKRKVLFHIGKNPRGFEVLGEICWPGKPFS